VRRPRTAGSDEIYEKILAIIERNTERISRLEDVFAMHVEQRAEVTEALQTVKSLLRRPRR
jgi:hypothetical protein